jgi:hypothetical protein
MSCWISPTYQLAWIQHGGAMETKELTIWGLHSGWLAKRAGLPGSVEKYHWWRIHFAAEFSSCSQALGWALWWSHLQKYTTSIPVYHPYHLASTFVFSSISVAYSLYWILWALQDTNDHKMGNLPLVHCLVSHNLFVYMVMGYTPRSAVSASIFCHLHPTLSIASTCHFRTSCPIIRHLIFSHDYAPLRSNILLTTIKHIVCYWIGISCSAIMVMGSLNQVLLN